MPTCEAVDQLTLGPFFSKIGTASYQFLSKLSCKSNVKDKTPFEEQHDLLYRSVCATNNHTKDCILETTSRHIVVRAKDHNGRDKHYHLVKHAIDNKYLL